MKSKSQDRDHFEGTTTHEERRLSSRKGFVGTTRDVYMSLIRQHGASPSAVAVYMYLEQRADHAPESRGNVDVHMGDLARELRVSQSTVRTACKKLEKTGWIIRLRRGNQHQISKLHLPRYPKSPPRRSPAPRAAASPGDRRSEVAPSDGAPSAAPSAELGAPPTSRRSTVGNDRDRNDFAERNQEPINKITKEPPDSENGYASESVSEAISDVDASRVTQVLAILERCRLRLALGVDPQGDGRYAQSLLRITPDLEVIEYAVARVADDPPREVRNPRGYFVDYLRKGSGEIRAVLEKEQLAKVPPAGSELGGAVQSVAAHLRSKA